MLLCLLRRSGGGVLRGEAAAGEVAGDAARSRESADTRAAVPPARPPRPRQRR